MPSQHVTPVIVFDGRPEPVAADNPMPAYGLPMTMMTGRTGSQGVAGDQNVLVLAAGEEVPEGTPDGKIIYRFLEA